MRIGCFTVPDPWFRSPFFDLLYLSGTRYSNYGYSETGSEFQKRWSCSNNATTSRGPPLPNLPLDSISCPPPCRNQSRRATMHLSSAWGGVSHHRHPVSRGVRLSWWREGEEGDEGSVPHVPSPSLSPSYSSHPPPLPLLSSCSPCLLRKRQKGWGGGRMDSGREEGGER